MRREGGGALSKVTCQCKNSEMFSLFMHVTCFHNNIFVIDCIIL